MSKILSVLSTYGSKALSLLSGSSTYIYIALFVIGFALGGYGSYYITANIYKTKLSSLTTTYTANENSRIKQDLTKYINLTEKINKSSNDYQAISINIDNGFAKIQEAILNATKTPLPVNCRPDTNRIRLLINAINDTNSTINSAN